MKKHFLLLGLSLVFLAACQEFHEMAEPNYVDPPLPPQEPPISLIKSVVSGAETSEYTYDDQNRQIKTKYNDGRSILEYLDGLIIQRLYKEDGSLDYFNTLEINEKGLKVSRTVSNNPSYLSTYDYDSDGRVIKTTSINGNNVFVGNHFYTNGNLDSVVYVRNDVLQYTYKYTYLTKPNTLNNKAYGVAYNGTDNEKLMKNWIGINASGNIIHQVSFAYSYDSKGRVKDMTQVANDDIDTFTYTYY